MSDSAHYIRGTLPHPDAPVVTVYTCTGEAYVEVTPDAKTLTMIVRPRDITDGLLYHVGVDTDYQTVPVGLPLVWDCSGSVFVRTTSADGVFTVEGYVSP